MTAPAPLEAVRRRAAALHDAEILYASGADSLRGERDDAIREALAAGHSLTEVAAAAGLSRSHVARLGHGQRSGRTAR